jgi:hypothetical protein
VLQKVVQDGVQIYNSLLELNETKSKSSEPYRINSRVRKYYAARRYFVQDRALAGQAWPRYPDRELDSKFSYKTVDVLFNSSGAVAVCLIILCPTHWLLFCCTQTTGMPSQSSLVPVSLPLVPRAGHAARTASSDLCIATS